jgi:hypothetical protein
MLGRARPVPSRSHSRMRAVPHASSTLVVKVLGVPVRSTGPVCSAPSRLSYSTRPPFRSALHQYNATSPRPPTVYTPSERACRPQHYTLPYPPSSTKSPQHRTKHYTTPHTPTQTCYTSPETLRAHTTSSSLRLPLCLPPFSFRQATLQPTPRISQAEAAPRAKLTGPPSWLLGSQTTSRPAPPHLQ